MTDRTVLITGATNGVGRLVAKRLGELGWFVLAHGRDAERGKDLVAQITAAGGQARFYRADFVSLAEVRRLADEVAEDCPRLSLLINNAGIGIGSPAAGRETSADGFELRFAVNYLAPFLLTRLLMPSILAADRARIVNVASAGQQELDFDDLQLEHGYSGVDAYCRSKLALIMLTFDLAADLADSNVTANALHPATFMDTFMVREAGATPISTVEDGADAIMHLAVSPEMNGRTGAYFDRFTPARARAQAYDAGAREILRRRSADLVDQPARG